MGVGRWGVAVVALATAGMALAGASCHSGVFGPSGRATCGECEVCPGGAGGAGGGGTGGGGMAGTGGQGGAGGGAGGEGGGASCPNDPEQGLVVHLRLDETAGELRDAIRDVTCSPRGVPGYRENGMHGSSIQFQGEDGFECGDLEPLHDLGALTVAAWICADEVPSQGAYQQSHIATKSANSVEDGGFGFYQIEDDVTLILDADLARHEILSNTPLVAGQWTHVAGVYDGESISVYVDGELDATKAVSGVVPGGTAPLVVGNSARIDVSPFGFRGRIDDVRAYDRALCAEEIAELAARQGWIFYNSTASGMLETWAAHDDGTSPVRLTDNLVGPASARGILGPVASWDGRQVAIGVEKDPNEVQDDYYLYVARADGAELRATAWMGEMCQGFGWDMLDRLVYAEHAPCEEALYRFDPQDVAEPTLIRAGAYEEPNPVYPAPNPATPNEVLVVGVDCNDSSFIQRVDAATGEMTLFPGPLPGMQVLRWFEAGDRFAYTLPGNSHDVRVYDLPSGTSAVVNVDGNPSAGYGYLAPGNGGARIYALRNDPALTRLDAVAIDLATGAVQTLVTDVDSRGISWAIVPFEIDRDGDGLGNGIDPTPEG